MADSWVKIGVLFAELSEYDDMPDLLAHLRTFFDGRADAEFFTDSPRPSCNQEMNILVLIDEALKLGGH